MTPSESDTTSFLFEQVQLWNDGKKDAFVDLYRTFVPAGYSVENPVGTPAHTGWEALDKLRANDQPVTTLVYEAVITAPTGEAGVCEKINATIDGATIVQHSLQTYDFVDEGVKARYYQVQAAPTGSARRDRPRAFLLGQAQAWSNGDRPAFFDAYREISSGGFFLQFPVDQPEAAGWELLERMWDQYQGNSTIHMTTSPSPETGRRGCTSATIRSATVRAGRMSTSTPIGWPVTAFTSGSFTRPRRRTRPKSCVERPRPAASSLRSGADTELDLAPSCLYLFRAGSIRSRCRCRCRCRKSG
ncbi:MAG: hypothetical protein JWM76_600 [Pseudonocardiales bacterium]|nr:hypothetical protein [Pseudonocardiales bacterium]